MKLLGYFRDNDEYYDLSDYIVRLLTCKELWHTQVVVTHTPERTHPDENIIPLVMLFGPDDVNVTTDIPPEAQAVLDHQYCYPIREGRIADYRLQKEHMKSEEAK